MSTLSLIPEERKRFLPTSSKSTESLYSSSSSKYSMSGLHRRKANRQAGFIPATNEVRQRVLSARLLRMKTLQNQLADAHQHIAALANENRILKTLHKRQDSALLKYEGSNAELPQLLHSHAEEIRISQAKFRNLQIQNKELSCKLKQKEAMLLAISDQNKHLTQLSKDRNLEERERLTNRVRYLEERLMEKDNDLKLLARRLQLETKSLKSQLQNEHQKYKDVMHKLERAKIDLGRFSQISFTSNEHGSRSSIIPRSLSGSKSTKLFRDAPKNLPLPMCSVSTPSLTRDRHSPVKPFSKSPESERSKSPTIRQYNNEEKPSRKSSAKAVNELNSFSRRNSKQESFAVKTLENELAESTESFPRNVEDENKLSDDDYENEEFLEDSPASKDADSQNDEDGNDEDNADDNDVIISKDPSALQSESKRNSVEIHKEFASLQRQLTEEYRQRESFLEAFCRQTTDEAATIVESIVETGRSSKSDDSILEGLATKRSSIDHKKKAKLLAALKAIDAGNGSEEIVN